MPSFTYIPVKNLKKELKYKGRLRLLIKHIQEVNYEQSPKRKGSNFFRFYQ